MNKLYYTVDLHLDSSYSWNGLRTITGFRIGGESFPRKKYLEYLLKKV